MISPTTNPRAHRRLLLLMALTAASLSGLSCSDGNGDEDAPEDSGREQPASDGRSVQIDLQEGFDGSAVEVLIDGTVVFSADEVTTRLLTGLADTFTADVQADMIRLEIRTAGEAGSPADIDLSNGSFIGVSIEDDQPVIIQADTAFGYG